MRFRIRLRPQAAGKADAWSDFDLVTAARREEADEFYGELTPATASDDEANVLRQAFAGMLWGKQLYYFDVARWLEGDPDLPSPPESRRGGRNARWDDFESFDIMSMPDKWEYPWFAAWDLPFHCIPLAHLDPTFAKYQLNLLCRERFQHSSGALPAYEWSFDDVNPPVQAWAALAVFAIDGARDAEFLAHVFDKLVLNFMWWVNRKDPDGSNLFEGGFLGLDNIGPIDRSHLPPGWVLEQSDATGWMAFYSLAMAAIAAVLYSRGRPATHHVHTFMQHFSRISDALHNRDLWDDEDGFFYDRLRLPDGSSVPVKVRSMVGIMPLVGVIDIDAAIFERAEEVDERVAALIAARQADVERLAAQGLIERHRRAAHADRRRRPRPRAADLHAALQRGGVPLAARPSGRSRASTSSTRSCSTSTGCSRRSRTSRPSRRPGCSGATRTGAARSGSRSTTSSSPRSCATGASSATG